MKATAPVLADTINTYDGEPHTVETTSVGSGGTIQYRASYNGNIEANYGTWQATPPTITNYSDATDGEGNQTGTMYVQAKVVGDSNHTDSEIATANCHVSSASMTVTPKGYEGIYDGNPHGIEVTVTKPLSGYTIYYSTKQQLNKSDIETEAQVTTTSPAKTDVGTYQVYWYVVSGSNNYTDKNGSNTITITPKTITTSMISLSTSSYTYDNTAHTLTVTVKDGSKTLVENTDYTLSYKNSTTNNDNRTTAGTVTVLVTGKGNYTGTPTKTYTINKANVTLNNIPTGLQYVGKDMSKSFTATASTAGAWKVTSNNTSRIGITGGASTTGTSDTIEYTGVAASTESTTITVTFTPTDQTNYNTPQSQTFTSCATECTASPAELTLYVGGDNGTVTLGGINHGNFTIAKNSDYAQSYTGTKFDASVSGTTLTLIPKAATSGAVTLTVKEGNGGKTTTVNITVIAANYIISEGSPKYHMTLLDAVTNCEDGGTVTALVNTFESDSITINKNLTINTNGKTLTRTAGTITASAGNITISGGGALVATANLGELLIFNGAANLNVTENTLIKSHGHVLQIRGSQDGRFKLDTGYLYSTNESTILVVGGSDNVTLDIKGISRVFTGIQNKGTIRSVAGTYTIIKIYDNAIVGQGENGTGAGEPCINLSGRSLIYVEGSIMESRYGVEAIKVRQ